MAKPKKKIEQFTFLATMGRFVIDGDGEAKLTLTISKAEALKMAELAQFNGKLLSCAVIVSSEQAEPKEKEDIQE
jgi:hypothetical protein